MLGSYRSPFSCFLIDGYLFRECRKCMVYSTLIAFSQTVISPSGDWRNSRCDSVLSLQQFLEKTAYPLLEGSASFLLSWLIDGQGGYLITSPSTSPEHYFIAPNGKKASVSYSTTMDMSIIREVFSAVLLSADVSFSFCCC